MRLFFILMVLSNFHSSLARENHLQFGLLLVCVCGRAIRMVPKCMYVRPEGALVRNAYANSDMKVFAHLSKTLAISNATSIMSPIGGHCWINSPSYLDSMIRVVFP